LQISLEKTETVYFVFNVMLFILHFFNTIELIPDYANVMYI